MVLQASSLSPQDCNEIEFTLVQSCNKQVERDRDEEGGVAQDKKNTGRFAWDGQANGKGNDNQ